ncbi:MAG: DNA polymerase III, subunit gamma and tau [Elusimicrobia bacterium RIFOXYD12_FULL_66_9]|nr:MAG: DNA polymerase III, subunit gamma and tau [Elusimicrobia bacterium RIFOXYD12_FULL_66_9]
MSKEKAAHQVFARKYRPQGFEELIGQPGVSETLKNALAAKRLHHAYLFTGPRGCGKTTTARILAKGLNCAEGPTPEPCDECVSCREITTSSSLDVMEMDAASNTGVDDVRQIIIETVGLAPSRDRYKIFIIDETHMLSTSAFNALLKTIEEPPSHIVFILATTELHKVPATIASRCQRFKFRPVAPDVLASYLAGIAKKEKISADPEALQLLSRAAEGSLRDAISLLDQCRSVGEGKVTLETVREMFGFVPVEMLLGAAQALLARDAKSLAVWLKKVYEEGVEPAQFLKDLRAALEAVYLEKLGAGAGAKADPAWSAALADATADGLGFLLRRLNRALEELRFGDSPRLALELGLFSALEAAHDLNDWLARLEALEKRLNAGGGGPALAAPAPRPAAATPAAAPVPAAAVPAMPVAAPASSGGTSWADFVEAVAREKISLGASLQKCAHEPRPDGGWTIRFAKAFDLEMAQRAQAFLEETLSAQAGRGAGLELALGGPDAPPVTDIVDAAIPETPGGAPAGARWKDVTGGADDGASHALKKAESVFGGKARIVKKTP